MTCDIPRCIRPADDGNTRCIVHRHWDTSPPRTTPPRKRQKCRLCGVVHDKATDCPEWHEMARLYLDEGLSLDHIGSRYGYTRERVRQIIKELHPAAYINQKLRRRTKDETLAKAIWDEVRTRKPEWMVELPDRVGITRGQMDALLHRNPDLFTGLSDALMDNRRNRTEKMCPRCGETKPITEFHKGGGADGHGALCKPCAIKRSANWNLMAAVRYTGTKVDAKRCPACSRHLPASSFAMDRSSRSGLQTYCADCQRRMAKGETVPEIAASYGVEYVRTRATF